MRAGKFTQLTPDLVENYDDIIAEAQKKLNGTPLGETILLLENAMKSGNNINNANNTFYADKDYPQVHQDNGRTFIIIDRQRHKWTSKYAADYMLPPNAAIERAVEKGFLIEGSKSGLSDEVLKFYTDTTEKMIAIPGSAMKKIPSLYLNTRNTHIGDNIANAHPQQTKEGEQMMLINRLFLEQPPAFQKKTLAHELGHIALGHTSPEAMAKLQNSGISQLEQMELGADRQAATITCDRDLLAGVNTVLANGGTPEITLAFSGHAQDIMQKRLAALQALSLPAECKAR